MARVDAGIRHDLDWPDSDTDPEYVQGSSECEVRGGAGIQTCSSRTGRDFPGRHYWETEPDVDRVVDGIPNRADRIKCLGNAVVPQQFYPFFKAIAMIEGGIV